MTAVLFATACEGWVLGKRLRKAITKVQKAAGQKPTVAHKGHPFCAETRLFCVEIELLHAETRMFCVEIELLGRNVTLFRGKRRTCSVEIRLFCVETCACCVEIRLFCVEICACCVEIRLRFCVEI